MTKYYSCHTCRKVAFIGDVSDAEAKCPLCGGTNGTVLTAEQADQGMARGVIFNFDGGGKPTTGRKAAEDKLGAAKRLVLREWRSWLASKQIIAPTENDAYIFYEYLKSQKRDLLDFKYSGDKWRVIKGWVMDPHALL